MLLNCVAECVLASPTRRYAVHGFETAVGRDLLAVGERGHTAGTGHAEWLLCSCLKLVPTQLVRSDHPGRLEPQAQMAAGWSSAGSYFGGSVSRLHFCVLCCAVPTQRSSAAPLSQAQEARKHVQKQQCCRWCSNHPGITGSSFQEGRQNGIQQGIGICATNI
ncbi:unnamed protein product, partial [Rangifer tarandus platyrhynchus]